jgi:hypothetical protein
MLPGLSGLTLQAFGYSGPKGVGRPYGIIAGMNDDTVWGDLGQGIRAAAWEALVQEEALEEAAAVPGAMAKARPKDRAVVPRTSRPSETC